MKETQEPTVELSDDDVVEKIIQRHIESLGMNPSVLSTESSTDEEAFFEFDNWLKECWPSLEKVKHILGVSSPEEYKEKYQHIENKRHELEDKWIVWFKDGFPHKFGSAAIYSTNPEVWERYYFRFGLLSEVNGPAVHVTNSNKEWWVNGYPIESPDKIHGNYYQDHSYFFFQNGVCETEIDFSIGVQFYRDKPPEKYTDQKELSGFGKCYYRYPKSSPKKELFGPELHVNFGGRGYTFPGSSTTKLKHSFFDSFGMIMLGLTIFAIIIATWLLS